MMGSIVWYKAILSIPITHPWWFWGITLSLIFLVVFNKRILYNLDMADRNLDFMTSDNWEIWHALITWIPIIALFLEMLLFIIASVSYLISLL